MLCDPYVQIVVRSVQRLTVQSVPSSDREGRRGIILGLLSSFIHSFIIIIVTLSILLLLLLLYYYYVLLLLYIVYYILFNIIFLQQHITITQYTGYYKCCHLYYIYFGVQII